MANMSHSRRPQSTRQPDSQLSPHSSDPRSVSVSPSNSSMIDRMRSETISSSAHSTDLSPEELDEMVEQMLHGHNSQQDSLVANHQGPVTKDSGRGRYAAYTTGIIGRGVGTQELAADGSWDTQNWLEHHSNRSRSWAAENIRNDKNQDLDAYDFTFERVDGQGRGINGSAQGLPLITPWDAKVIDIQSEYQGSGGYGRFIALEDLTTGMRFEVHHLDTVSAFSKGQVIKGGTEIGTQGASGSKRYEYATHVDIVGTPQSVEDFVRANQTGTFKTTEQREGA